MFPKLSWRETQPGLVASLACTSDIVLAWPFACLFCGAHRSVLLADHWRVVFPQESRRLVAPMKVKSLERIRMTKEAKWLTNMRLDWPEDGKYNEHDIRRRLESAKGPCAGRLDNPFRYLAARMLECVIAAIRPR